MAPPTNKTEGVSRDPFTSLEVAIPEGAAALGGSEAADAARQAIADPDLRAALDELRALHPSGIGMRLPIAARLQQTAGGESAGSRTEKQVHALQRALAVLTRIRQLTFLQVAEKSISEDPESTDHRWGGVHLVDKVAKSFGLDRQTVPLLESAVRELDAEWLHLSPQDREAIVTDLALWLQKVPSDPLHALFQRMLDSLSLESRCRLLEFLFQKPLGTREKERGPVSTAKTILGSLTLSQVRALRQRHPDLHSQLKLYLLGDVEGGDSPTRRAMPIEIIGRGFLEYSEEEPLARLIIRYAAGEPMPENPEGRKLLSYLDSLGSLEELDRIGIHIFRRYRYLSGGDKPEDYSGMVSRLPLLSKARLLWVLQYYSLEERQRADPEDRSSREHRFTGAIARVLEQMTPDEIRKLALLEGNPLSVVLRKLPHLSLDHVVRAGGAAKSDKSPLEKRLVAYMTGSPLPDSQGEKAILSDLGRLGTLHQINQLFESFQRAKRLTEGLALLPAGANRRLLRVLAYATDGEIPKHIHDACRAIIGALTLEELPQTFHPNEEPVAQTVAHLLGRGLDLLPEFWQQLPQRETSHPLSRIARFMKACFGREKAPVDPVELEAFEAFVDLGTVDEVTRLFSLVEFIENPPMEERDVSDGYDDNPSYVTGPSNRNFVSDVLSEFVGKKGDAWKIAFLKVLFQAGIPVFTNDKFFALFTGTVKAISPAELARQPTISGSPFSKMVASFGQGLPFVRELWEQSIASGDPGAAAMALAARVDGYKEGKRLPNEPTDDDLLAYVLSEIEGDRFSIDPENVRSGKNALREFVNRWKQFVASHVAPDAQLAVPRLSRAQRNAFVTADGSDHETLKPIIDCEELGWNVRLLQAMKVLPDRADLTESQFQTAKYILAKLTPKQLSKVKTEPGSPLETMVHFRNAGVPLTEGRWKEARASGDVPHYLDRLQARIDAYRRGGHLSDKPSDEDLLLAYESFDPPSSFTFDAFKELMPLDWKNPPPPFLAEAFQGWIPTEKSAHQEIDKSGLPEILRVIGVFDKEAELKSAWNRLISEAGGNLKQIKPVLDEIFPEGVDGLNVSDLLDKWQAFLARLAKPENAKSLKNALVKKLLAHAVMALAWNRNAGTELRADVLALLPLLDRDEQQGRARRDISSQALVTGIRRLSEFYTDSIGHVLGDAGLGEQVPAQVRAHRDSIGRMMAQIKVLEGEKVLVEFIPSSSKIDIAIAEVTDDCSRDKWKRAIYRKDIQIIRLLSQNRLAGALYLQETILDGQNVLVVGIQPREGWAINKKALLAVIEGHLARIASLPSHDYDAIALRSDGHQQTNRPDMLHAIKERKYEPWPTELAIEGGIFQGNSFLVMWKKGRPLPDTTGYDSQPVREEVALTSEAVSEAINGEGPGRGGLGTTTVHPARVLVTAGTPELGGDGRETGYRIDGTVVRIVETYGEPEPISPGVAGPSVAMSKEGRVVHLVAAEAVRLGLTETASLLRRVGMEISRGRREFLKLLSVAKAPHVKAEGMADAEEISRHLREAWPKLSALQRLLLRMAVATKQPREVQRAMGILLQPSSPSIAVQPNGTPFNGMAPSVLCPVPAPAVLPVIK